MFHRIFSVEENVSYQVRGYTYLDIFYLIQTMMDAGI
jgi:hypothetical protein